MLTLAQVEDAESALENGKLKATAVKLLLTHIRSFSVYRDNRVLYPSLETRLGAASGDTAKILQAALTAIEAVGSGQEAFGSDASSGAQWSRTDNRNEFVMDALNALYEVPAAGPSSAVVKAGGGFCGAHSCLRSLCGCTGSSSLIF